MIKIIFFDIDGTLVKLKSTIISNKVAYALNEVQKQGVKLFIATGRPIYMLPKFENVSFDGYLTFNGGYCYDKNQVLYSNPMDKDDVQILLSNARDMHVPVVLAGIDTMGYDYPEETLLEYFRIGSQFIGPLDDYEGFSKGDIFQMMCAIPQEKEKERLKDVTKIQCTRWWDKACDIIPTIGGKEHGIHAILKAYGYTKEEAMAFGDGGNDKTMLEAVGCGIAIGNAKDEVKQIADYITDSVEEDGIYTALVKMGMVKPL